MMTLQILSGLNDNIMLTKNSKSNTGSYKNRQSSSKTSPDTSLTHLYSYV